MSKRHSGVRPVCSMGTWPRCTVHVDHHLDSNVRMYGVLVTDAIITEQPGSTGPCNASYVKSFALQTSCRYSGLAVQQVSVHYLVVFWMQPRFVKCQHRAVQRVYFWDIQETYNASAYTCNSSPTNSCLKCCSGCNVAMLQYIRLYACMTYRQQVL